MRPQWPKQTGTSSRFVLTKFSTTMSTGNFHNMNARKVFAVLTSYDQPVIDDDGNETDETETHAPESWECDEFISSIKEEALKRFGHMCSEGGKVESELRSYPAQPLFTLSKSQSFAGVDIEVIMTSVLRSAYYDGANLDWELAYYLNGSEWDHIDFIEDFKYNLDNKGMAAIQCKHAERWTQKIQSEMIDTLEKFYTEKSLPLNVVARFSNGETIYAKA